MFRLRLVLPGLVAAGLFALLAGLVHWVFRPLHADGRAQDVGGFLNGLEYMMQFTGRLAVGVLRVRFGPDQHEAAWLTRTAISTTVYFLGGSVAAALWCRLRHAAPATTSPPRAGRRRFLSITAAAAAASATAGFGYALTVEPRWFTVTRRSLPLRGLPPELDGLRLVQLTDIHHGPWLSLDYVRQVVDAANGLEPDLVLLTGDYIAQSSCYIVPVMTELGRLRPRIGCVAVLGNHDWWEDGRKTRRELTRVGVRLLDNTRLVLTPDRRLVVAAPAGLALCGVGDLDTHEQFYGAALGGLPTDMPRLLLSHNPDVAEEQEFRACGERVDLMVSGHTHGGQVAIPFMGTPMLPSKYGQKYASGLVQGPTCPVFVCRGIGLSNLPVRLGVSPEIAVLELRRGL